MVTDSQMDGKMTADAERILGLHFLDETIMTSDVRSLTSRVEYSCKCLLTFYSMFQMFGVMAEYLGSGVQDRVWFWNDDGKLHVDGGGVQAKIVDYVLASNGVIQSIDYIFYMFIL
jgi:hypothetical protein